jgi:DegV family protein with EDD domain
MASVALVTDSTAYLPPELVEKHNISVIPLYVRFGEEVFRDNVDMKPDQFYSRLKTSPVMPATSQPSAGDFIELFRSLVAGGASAILCVLISSKLSGTVASATLAQDQIADVPIHLVDTLSTSMGQGFLVLEAARALEAGRPVEEVVASLEKRREKTRLLFAVDTLEFLHKGGRIGGAQAFLGSMLNLKPILALREGRVEAVERVRTRKRVRRRLLDMVVEESAGKPMRVAVIHASEEGGAAALRQEAEARLNCQEVVVAEMSPTIGTHTGPGTVGIVLHPVDVE